MDKTENYPIHMHHARDQCSQLRSTAMMHCKPLYFGNYINLFWFTQSPRPSITEHHRCFSKSEKDGWGVRAVIALISQMGDSDNRRGTVKYVWLIEPVQSCNALTNLVGTPKASCENLRVSACLCNRRRASMWERDLQQAQSVSELNYLTQSFSVLHPTIKEKGVRDRGLPLRPL